MASGNPFRERLRRRDATFKTVARNANEHGKDGGSNTDLAIGPDYLWIAFDFSVPLSWISSVEPLGPGFIVVWDNPIEKSEEWASFCFLRTGWGYDTKKRDEVVGLIRDAASKATWRPLVREVSVAQTAPSCQKCADPNPRVYDFMWYTSFLTYSIGKPDRVLLCPSHGASRVRVVTIYNLLLGNLGFGVFVSPVVSLRNLRAARAGEALRAIETYAWIAVAFLPYALLAWLVGLSLWTAFTL